MKSTRRWPLCKTAQSERLFSRNVCYMRTPLRTALPHVRTDGRWMLAALAAA